MKKLLQIVIILILSSTLHAQNTAWITQLNEEENFVAAGATKYFTVSKTPYNNRTYTVRSFNSSGTPLLATTIFPNSQYTNMTIIKILATSSDELYILGNISFGTTFRCVLIKLNSNLLQPWMREITQGVKTYGIDLAVKGSNITVLTAFYPTATGGTRAGLTSCSISNGNIVQSSQPTFDFAPRQMAIDGNQNVYVCGGSELSLNQARVVKFNSSLIVTWNFLTTLASSTTTLTPFEFVQVDIAGNVYVGGNSFNSTWGVFRNEVRKLSSSGTQVSSYVSSNINSHELIKAMKLNIAGSLFYVSRMQSSVGDYVNHRIVKLSTATALAYQNSFVTNNVWPTSGVTLTGFEVTQGGAVFMTGKRTGTSNLTINYLSFKLKSNWTYDFSEKYNGGRCNSLIKAIPGSFPNDEFVTTGVIGNINMLIKYTGVAPKLTPDLEPSPVAEITKMTCYPNPANSFLTIQGITDLNGIKLIDLSGKQHAIQTMDSNFDGTTYNIKIDVSQLAKGIYILSAINHGKVENIKLVVDH
ncbi:MAG: T9SS type A sorting domain-containing protein [Bacteroidia bacterium]|nr:T9SS type A sorting domain-containing protein [Bacteroidia bacterium]